MALLYVGPALVWAASPAAVAAASPAATPGLAIPPAAEAAWAEGAWDRAASVAAAQGSADSLAFAARARLAPLLLAGASRARMSDVAAARRLAEQALALEPRHIEARLQLATSLGIEARRTNPAMALIRRLPQRTRALVDGVRADAPTEAWAHALLGGWHLEGLRIGGRDAERVLGVNLTAGRQAFGRAVALAPHEPAIPFYFSCALLALDDPALVAEARSAANLAATRPAEDAFNRQVAPRGARLRELIDRADLPAARALARSWL